MKGRSGPLHAAGDLETMGRAWWRAHMRSPLSEVQAITVAGDGGLRFHWRDHEESGTYHVPLWRIYSETPHHMGRPVADDPAKLGDGVGAISDEGSPATDDLNPLGGRSDSSAQSQPSEALARLHFLCTQTELGEFLAVRADDLREVLDYLAVTETAVLDAALSDRLGDDGSPLTWREIAEDQPKSTLHGAHTEGGEG